jgi:hypothetical protein
VVGCGVSFVLLTWCIKKRGPVFVAAFIPVAQIIVSVMDFTVLHETLYLGRYSNITVHLIMQTYIQIQSFATEIMHQHTHDWHLKIVLLQMYICSVLGSVFVIGGLYLLLWGKREEALQHPPKVAEDDREQQQQVQLQP